MGWDATYNNELMSYFQEVDIQALTEIWGENQSSSEPIDESDSDLAVQVKAFSLKAINDIDQALIHYEELFKRKPNPFIAYELAEMKIRTGDLMGATRNITS